jgi:hypothetical protein
LSSQYEKIHFHHIDSSLSNSKQRINENQEENIQFDLLTIEKIKHDQREQSIEDIKINENSFEKANKRLDGMYHKQFF